MPQYNQKTFLCKDQYACHVCNVLKRNPFTEIRGNYVRKCRNVNCYGAHSEEEIRTKPHIKKFNSLDFSKFNLGKYDEAIYTVLNSCVGKISDAVLAKGLTKIKSMNFIERLQLYVKISYYKSALKKRGGSLNIRLNIDNPADGIVEDHIWALERITHMCPHHMEIKRKFAANEKVTIRDTCLGSTNCKWGVHHEEQLINIADLMTGISDAKYTKETYDRDYAIITQQISEISAKIESLEHFMRKNNESNGWSSRKSSNYESKKSTSNYIFKLKKLRHVKIRSLKQLPRQIHLTERGLTPMCVYIKKKEELKEKEKIKLEGVKDVSRKKNRKFVVKPMFD
jgi:hypothetical protein